MHTWQPYLQTAKNFFKAIVQHVVSSGLLDARVESWVLGARAVVQYLQCGNFKRAMCTPKLTIQSMWIED